MSEIESCKRDTKRRDRTRQKKKEIEKRNRKK